MEIVEINSPRSIDLNYMYGANYHYGEKKLQSIDIYDTVSLCIKKNNYGNVIKSNYEFNDNIKNLIEKLINIFSIYTKKNIIKLNVNIVINDSYLQGDYYNILAGILIGLNQLYRAGLSKRELMAIGNLIDLEISYYILGGCRFITSDHNVVNVNNNSFSKYYIIKRNLLSEEDLRLHEFLLAYRNLKFGKMNNIYFVALRENQFIRLPLELKKEFHHIICNSAKNTNGHKVLVKYIK